MKKLKRLKKRAKLARKVIHPMSSHLRIAAERDLKECQLQMEALSSKIRYLSEILRGLEHNLPGAVSRRSPTPETRLKISLAQKKRYADLRKKAKG